MNMRQKRRRMGGFLRLIAPRGTKIPNFIGSVEYYDGPPRKDPRSVSRYIALGGGKRGRGRKRRRGRGDPILTRGTLG
jgi:hypothetical protein